MTRVLTPAETENVSVTLFVNKTMSCHAIIMIDMVDFFQHGLLPVLLKMQLNTPSELAQSEISQALSLIGYVQPPRGRGVNILAIDGGGPK